MLINSVKTLSIMKIIKAIIKEAIATTTELFCNSSHVGQVTLCNNSSNEDNIDGKGQNFHIKKIIKKYSPPRTKLYPLIKLI